MLLMCIAECSAEHDLKHKSLKQDSQKQIQSSSVISGNASLKFIKKFVAIPTKKWQIIITSETKKRTNQA